MAVSNPLPRRIEHRAGSAERLRITVKGGLSSAPTLPLEKENGRRGDEADGARIG